MHQSDESSALCNFANLELPDDVVMNNPVAVVIQRAFVPYATILTNSEAICRDVDSALASLVPSKFIVWLISRTCSLFYYTRLSSNFHSYRKGEQVFERFISRYIQPLLKSQEDTHGQFLITDDLKDKSESDIISILRRCSNTYIQIATLSQSSIALLHITRPMYEEEPFQYELKCVTNNASPHHAEEELLCKLALF